MKTCLVWAVPLLSCHPSELVRDHGISDTTYARARAAFGEPGVIELVSVVGYYCLVCLVALVLNAFEVPVEAGVPDPFPG